MQNIRSIEIFSRHLLKKVKCYHNNFFKNNLNDRKTHGKELEI